MDYLPELRRLEHQLELARRAVSLISDGATVERLEAFAREIGVRLRGLRAASLEDETRRRAHELWENAGRPEGRDLEFWLQAERVVRHKIAN
ncbi:hypothetical protein ABIB83_008061 [Bradyrhizobium sp. I1.8.5]|uniref:DUF2934 domain-containing protein n=1 Tax=Bradyrhizobium sp. I1.8.5 TaxID=3156365 RepID=UPI00339603BE